MAIQGKNPASKGYRISTLEHNLLNDKVLWLISRKSVRRIRPVCRCAVLRRREKPRNAVGILLKEKNGTDWDRLFAVFEANNGTGGGTRTHTRLP